MIGKEAKDKAFLVSREVARLGLVQRLLLSVSDVDAVAHVHPLGRQIALQVLPLDA